MWACRDSEEVGIGGETSNNNNSSAQQDRSTARLRARFGFRMQSAPFYSYQASLVLVDMCLYLASLTRTLPM